MDIGLSASLWPRWRRGGSGSGNWPRASQRCRKRACQRSCWSSVARGKRSSRCGSGRLRCSSWIRYRRCCWSRFWFASRQNGGHLEVIRRSCALLRKGSRLSKRLRSNRGNLARLARRLRHRVVRGSLLLGRLQSGRQVLCIRRRRRDWARCTCSRLDRLRKDRWWLALLSTNPGDSADDQQRGDR